MRSAPAAVRLATTLATTLGAPLAATVVITLAGAAAPAAEASPHHLRADLTRPVPGRGAPARPFERPAHNWLPGHRGVDLAAVAGTTVRAPGAGRVDFVGVVAGRPVVSLVHDGGLRTTYEPVRAVVTTGTEVGRGEVLGTLLPGHPGCPQPACLHWGALVGRDDYVDPLTLLALRERVIRLKPVR